MKEFFPVLHAAPLFSGISDEELAAMLSCLGARIGTFPKGSRLLRLGDMVEEVGLVLTGSALVVQEDIWGNRNILSKAGPGQTFAEVFACAPGAAMNSTFRSPASSLRIISVWSAAGCRWSLEKCGMRGFSTFTKATFFSKCRMRTAFFLLRVKEPPSGVSASADAPDRHGALGFCRRKRQLRSVEIGRSASARTI